MNQDHIINKVKIMKMICDALGVDPMKVSSVAITVDSDPIPKAVVTFPLFNGAAERIAQAMKSSQD